MDNVRQVYGGSLTKMSRNRDLHGAQRCASRLETTRRGGGFHHRNRRSCSLVRRAAAGDGGDGGVQEEFSEEDEDYVDATVVEAVEVQSGLDGFYMKMYNGTYVKCIHNSATGGRLPDYPSQPAIVLKLNDGSDLLLPILVLELPQTMLMEAIHGVPLVRPTVYHVIRDLVEIMQYEVKLVRVTHRVMEAYHARIYLKSWGDGQIISLDMRPSDAVNLAVRCKVAIQVNKHLAAGDGVRIVQDSHRTEGRVSHNVDLDSPEEKNSFESEEFVLVRNMIVAAVEERYNDAARLRDQLKKLRSKQSNQEA
ncbi:hypothetical protein CBR_g3165 [Chara braunii]|uniref:BFN domain-containing protein n=1 Tax=Chara braunii TaxID=69332 RepID=A0A388KEZ2_CHABU|nr:hypothetical protein CBR_g3165 [Chara braunii]|eukprot:GBG68624.1 hypothetical protein CBR_g3165 [Chara braunii]